MLTSCEVCHHDKVQDAPCKVCGFCGLADGYATFALLPSSSTLVNDAHAMAHNTVRAFLCAQEDEAALTLPVLH